MCLFLTLLHLRNTHGERKAASDANYEGKNVFFFMFIAPWWKLTRVQRGKRYNIFLLFAFMWFEVKALKGSTKYFELYCTSSRSPMANLSAKFSISSAVNIQTE